MTRANRNFRAFTLGVLFVSLVAACTEAFGYEVTLEGGASFYHNEHPAVGLHVKADIFEAGMVLLPGEQAAVEALVVGQWRCLEAGVGLAALAKRTDLNGGKANFSLKLGCAVSERVTIAVRHWSSGGIWKPNSGWNLLVVEVRVK